MWFWAMTFKLFDFSIIILLRVPPQCKIEVFSGAAAGKDGDTLWSPRYFLSILTKRWFLRVKCRNYGKIRIFGKWPIGLFYDPPCTLTSCKKSEKSNERILRKMRKTPFLVNLGPFWAHLSPNGPNRNFFQKSGFVTFFPLLNYIIMQKIRKI